MCYTKVTMSHSHRPIPRKTLAQELADTLTEEIVAGDRPARRDAAHRARALRRVPGSAAASCADATRIPLRKGAWSRYTMGRGAYVTESQLDAFGEGALFLALRREHASVWDVEEFFLVVWPEVFAMATRARHPGRAQRDPGRRRRPTWTPSGISHRRRHSKKREAHRGWAPSHPMTGTGPSYKPHFRRSHNKVFALMFGPFHSVRSLRNWESPDASADEARSN